MNLNLLSADLNKLLALFRERERGSNLVIIFIVIIKFIKLALTLFIFLLFYSGLVFWLKTLIANCRLVLPLFANFSLLLIFVF